VNISTFIARRIAFNQQKSFSRFIIRLSVVATVISVMVMIITLSFVNGFQETVSKKVFSMWGHVRVQYRQPVKSAISEEEPIEKNDSLVKAIKGQPGVRTIHPFATKNAILKTEEEIEGVLLKGVDQTFDFKNLQDYLQEGRWIQFNDSSYANEIVISTFTAKQLKLKLNESVLLYFVQPDQSMRVRKLKIVGIYKTGIEEYDKNFSIADIKLIRRLNNWEDYEIGGYEIFLKDHGQMQQASNAIFDLDEFPQTWETRTAKDIQPNIFDWLQVINTNSAVLIIIMIVIAIINFITCLIILVLERVQMIGTLKALGATDWAVQKIFLNHSILITLFGILAGTGLALLLLWIQNTTGFVRLPEDAYYMDRAAVKINWLQVLFVAGGTLAISFLVLLVPSIIVRKIQPIKAIHFR
jgi:lipoprotein-releasing system permease protein